MDEARVRLRGLADARARAIDEVRLDRDDPPVLHRADRGPARPRRDLLGLRRIRCRRETIPSGTARKVSSAGSWGYAPTGFAAVVVPAAVSMRSVMYEAGPTVKVLAGTG